MASVYIDNYHVYYSLTTGEVKEFEESNFTPVVENYDKKLEYVVGRIMKSEQFKISGYPAFVKARLDCEKKDCVNYGGLGCHGADDPMNQTCCKLDLKDATKCLNSKPTYLYKDVRRNREVRTID